LLKSISHSRTSQARHSENQKTGVTDVILKLIFADFDSQILRALRVLAILRLGKVCVGEKWEGWGLDFLCGARGGGSERTSEREREREVEMPKGEHSFEKTFKLISVQACVLVFGFI